MAREIAQGLRRGEALMSYDALHGRLAALIFRKVGELLDEIALHLACECGSDRLGVALGGFAMARGAMFLVDCPAIAGIRNRGHGTLDDLAAAIALCEAGTQPHGCEDHEQRTDND
jgi:hypothetical protein